MDKTKSRVKWLSFSKYFSVAFYSNKFKNFAFLRFQKMPSAVAVRGHHAQPVVHQVTI
jgi:hypothetical protein